MSIHDNSIDTNRFRIVLGSHLTTSVSDDNWELFGQAHIACWESAKSLLGEFGIDFHGRSLELRVDWSPALRLVKRYHAAMRLTEDSRSADSVKNLGKFPSKSIVMYVTVSNSTIVLSDHTRSYGRSVVESYLYDFFMIMNLASPASCDFYNTRISDHNVGFTTDIRLSNYHFESALLDSSEGVWPKVSFIDLENVVKWFRLIRSPFKMVPGERMEKVIFALLHISKNDLSVVTVIWIFYALETLFDTKVGENFNSLISRIELLLCPNALQIKQLRKKMRDLYDLRSAFVHGGFSVIHPIHNEAIDPNVEIVYGRVFEAVSFGFQVILASMQEIIKRGWRQPNFEQVLLGVN